MNYQELLNVLGQNQNAFSGVVPANVRAPSIDQIISGISSQYQPINLGSYGPSVGGASRYITGSPSFGDIEQIPEYGRLNQISGPSFVPAAFDKSVYEGINNQKLSDLISQIDSGVPFESYGGFGGNSGSNSVSVDDAGLATSSNIGTTGVSIGAMALGAMTGLPLGLISNVVGKQNIANAINNQSNAQAAAFNQALVAAQMGLANTPANAAALAAAVDSLSAANQSTAAAVSAAQAAQGATGATGGSAAAAAAAAAASAAAAGHSDAAIGAAAQAAADAAIGGASASAAAAAAADAANAAAADAADADGGGLGTASSAAADAAASGVAAADGVGMDGMGVGNVGADSGGGGGAGAKIICTKLHALGLMPTNIYEADQAFGKKLVSESPETYYGYVRWAQHVVDLMGRDDLLGKTAVFCSYHIATPWSLAMAEEMGQPVKASWFGKFLMKRGLQFCKFIGSKNKEMALS